MIEELHVRGMGGIKSASLFFSGKFIAITGESGTGKSSLVRAFEFIAGRRAQISLIHSDSSDAAVEAVWSELFSDENLITSRTLARGGKGKCLSHGTPVTVSQLSELSAPMIEIQSQFAQLNLLEPARQLELVDICGGAELRDVKESLAGLFPAMLASEREILDIKKRREELESRLDGAPDRVRRIKKLSLSSGCEDAWAEELAQMERQLTNADRLDNIIFRMDGGESGVELLETLGVLLRDLCSVASDEERMRWTELGEAALCSLQEVFKSARSSLGMTTKEELESGIEATEAKIGMLRRLKREVGVSSADALVSYMAEVDRDAKWMKESSSILEERSAKAQALRSEVAALARKLRALRESAAREFEARVNYNLADLAMAESRFSVDVIRHDRVRANGAESVSFLLAVKDMQPTAVGKVASGGELSRILIAIQASIDPARLPGTLVFDEVEAGLGGRAALLAGEKLKEFSKSCRTILITHEATIAAMADQHFLVRRVGSDTDVTEIDGGERVLEIARMLSGSDSREAVEHARALLFKDDETAY